MTTYDGSVELWLQKTNIITYYHTLSIIIPFKGSWEDDIIFSCIGRIFDPFQGGTRQDHVNWPENPRFSPCHVTSYDSLVEVCLRAWSWALALAVWNGRRTMCWILGSWKPSRKVKFCYNFGHQFWGPCFFVIICLWINLALYGSLQKKWEGCCVDHFDPSLKDTVGIMMRLRSSVPVTVEERSKVVIVAHFADFNLRLWQQDRPPTVVAGGNGGNHNSLNEWFFHL